MQKFKRAGIVGLATIALAASITIIADDFIEKSQEENQVLYSERNEEDIPIKF